MTYLRCVESSPEDEGYTPTVDRCGNKQSQCLCVCPDSLKAKQTWRGGGARTPPETPKAPTLQACGGLLRGDVLHHLSAPEDDVEPGVSL